MRRLFFLLFFLIILSGANAQNAADSIAFERLMKYAESRNLKMLCNPGGRIRAVAEYFLGTPYVGGTLEAPGPEQLRVNLHELDCTTLVETVLAISRTIVSPNPSPEVFRQQLKYIRYRGGSLVDYTSRLHYSTDWIHDNLEKKIFLAVDMGKQSVEFKPAVNFMSAHPSAYPALKADSLFVQVMSEHEKRINTYRMPFLPKEFVTSESSFIHDGDLILITTLMAGLDFSHMGVAVRKNGQLFLLHASSSAGKVVVSDVPLSDYLAGIKKHTGIVVLRPLR